jgi:hypothetical protein
VALGIVAALGNALRQGWIRPTIRSEHVACHCRLPPGFQQDVFFPQFLGKLY